MTRKNFPKPVQRAALDRANGQCEGVGELYGHAPGVRCKAIFAKGVNFDHVNGDSNGGKPTLENCAAVCPPCNQFKNNKTDTPRAAKGLRQQDNARGIVGTKQTIPQRRALKAAVEKGSSHASYLERMSAKGKPVPQRKIT